MSAAEPNNYESYLKYFDLIKEEAGLNPGDWEASYVCRRKRGTYEKFFNKKYLKTFRRTPMAVGEQNWPDIPGNSDEPWLLGINPKKKYKGYFFLKERLDLFKNILNEIGQPFIASDYQETRIGNPCFYIMPGIGCVTEASIRYGFYLSRIRYFENKYSKKERFDSLLEIGGGFGGLAGRIISSKRPKLYFLTDLTENLLTTYYYLKRLFDDVQFIINTNDLSKIKSRGIYILTPWLLKEVDQDIECVINTMSFQHMSCENCKFYFEAIEKLKINYIYHVNRNTVRDHTDVIVDDYPISPNYKLLYREKFFVWDHLECFYERNN